MTETETGLTGDEAARLGRSAADDIADRLRGQINGGVLGPGDRLPNERDLAGRFGVARPTLREALRQLIGEGYLYARRGNAGGTFVSDLAEPSRAWLHRMRSAPADLIDLFEFRIAVEEHAAALAADRRSTEHLAAMTSAISDAENARSRNAFREADHRFHLTVALAAGSARLSTAVQHARGEIFVPVDMVGYEDHYAQNCREHSDVVEAIRAGDAAGARDAMATHLRNTLADLLDQFGSDPA